MRVVAACLLALAACEEGPSPSQAVHHDLGANHCPVRVQRPDDCLETPQCIYFDARLNIDRAEHGGLEVFAESVSQAVRTRSKSVRASSPYEIASHLDSLMHEVGVTVPTGRACVSIVADQSLSLGEVAALQRTLAPHVRYVDFGAQLAD